MTQIRQDWTRDEIAGLFELPFTELLFQAASDPPREPSGGSGATVHFAKH